MKIFLTTLVALVLFNSALSGQIYFEIEFNSDVEEYVLSIHSDEEWATPFNRTSTAQLTVKAPAGTFFPDEIKSLIPNVHWEHNSTYRAPSEAQEYDYFSFGLISNGTDDIKYLKANKIPIISFTNKLDCSDHVQLIDNETDEFMYPNRAGANIGNHITVLGAMKANSYTGNINETTIPCQNIQADDNKYLLQEYFSVFPNPTKGLTNISADWPFDGTEAEATLLDLAGRVIQVKSITIEPGSNRHEFDLSNVSSGIYYIKLSNADFDVVIDEVAKIE